VRERFFEEGQSDLRGRPRIPLKSQTGEAPSAIQDNDFRERDDKMKNNGK